MKIAFTSDDRTSVTADLLVVGANAADDPALSDIDSALGGSLEALLDDHGFKGKRSEAVVLPTYGKLAATRVAIVGTDDASLNAVSDAAGKAGMLARDVRATSIALALGDLDATTTTALLEHLQVGNYFYDTYLPEEGRRPSLSTVTLVGADASPALEAAADVAAKRGTWQRYTRDLVNGPAADIYPATLAEQARKLAELPNVEVEVWDWERCKKENLVGVIAVGRGSTKPGCMIHVRYRPPSAKEHIALVGKGVTFDSGGLSLKPSAAMQTMRCDMGGGATALGATGAIAALGLPVALDTFVPAVENMCAADSFKLGDILRYNNGVTVEIHNTDAEGRLILADALILASKVKGVSRIIDMATLTGAIIVSIGQDYTGMFTADDDFAAELTAASHASNERMWRMPLHEPYKRMLKGTWGRIKNVGGRAAGSVTAALFLHHFVGDDKRWVHLDIAGTAFADTAVDPYVTGGTGQVVRTLTTWAESLVSD